MVDTMWKFKKLGYLVWILAPAHFCGNDMYYSVLVQKCICCDKDDHFLEHFKAQLVALYSYKLLIKN